MTDGKSLKTYISEEKAKWSSFNKEQKIQYFKDYYLIKSVLLLLAIVMITSLLCETVFLRKEIVYSGCAVNIELDSEAKQFLTEEYLNRLGKKSRKQEVSLADCYIDFHPEEQVMDSNYDQSVLYAQLAVKEYDYLLLDESALTGLVPMEIYDDLSQILPKEWMSAHEDVLVSLDMADGTYPVAIDVSDTFLSDHTSSEKIYLAFVVTTHQTEKTRQFLEYLSLF